jgi:hypothetical protein
MGVAGRGVGGRGPEEEGYHPNSISPPILVGIRCPRW